MKKLMILLVLLLLACPILGAGRSIYVDGDGGEDNTKAGTTADPLLGLVGLQRAIRQDESGGGSGLGITDTDTNNITVYLRDTVSVTATLTIDSNTAQTVGFNKRLIGCSGSGTTWTPLTSGNYTQLSATAALNAAIVTWIDTTANAGRMEFRNIWFVGNNSGTPASSEHGVSLSAAATVTNFTWINCKFSDLYNSINCNDSSNTVFCFSDCVILQAHNYGFYALDAINADNIFINNDSTGIGFYALLDGSTISNSTISGGIKALSLSTGSSLIDHVSCFDQTVACIDITSTAKVRIFNCILDVNDTASDYAIYNSAGTGTIMELNNITDADTRLLAGFINNDFSGSVYNLVFTTTDPWMNTATGDFRFGSGTIATTYVKDKGFRMYGDGTSDNRGYSSIGSWQATQTQAGGGGGQRILGGGVVR